MASGRKGRFLGLESERQLWGPWTSIMETESEQNSNSTNGSSGSGGSSRPQIAQMSLYERQAVQALQALQRQPNAAQYFHQFMLQQQLSNAQLHSLAAVQQVRGQQPAGPGGRGQAVQVGWDTPHPPLSHAGNSVPCLLSSRKRMSGPWRVGSQ
uniref:Polyhomeotic homolog 1 n=1 Tax=Ovis aries TaxID=9940 RepID=A0AC11EEE4_SHEEP